MLQVCFTASFPRGLAARLGFVGWCSVTLNQLASCLTLSAQAFCHGGMQDRVLQALARRFGLAAPKAKPKPSPKPLRPKPSRRSTANEGAERPKKAQKVDSVDGPGGCAAADPGEVPGADVAGDVGSLDESTAAHAARHGNNSEKCARCRPGGEIDT